MWSTTAGTDVPDNVELDFVYADSDSLSAELAELYCYTEEQEILNNQSAFEQWIKTHIKTKTSSDNKKIWSSLDRETQNQVLDKLSEGTELVREEDRWNCIQCLLYLSQGVFGECDTIGQCFSLMRSNVYRIYETGVFSNLIHILVWETEKSDQKWVGKQQQQPQQTRQQQQQSSGSNCNLSDSYKLRLILSLIYTFVEIMRREDEEFTEVDSESGTESVCTDPDRKERERLLRQQFRDELNEQICSGSGSPQLLSVFLFQMVTRFGNNSSPHYPIRKVLLLLWKVLLLTLGGSNELTRLKNEYRNESGLPEAPDDTLTVVKTMRAASPPVNANEVLEAQNQRKLAKPLKRQMFVKQTSVSLMNPGGGSATTHADGSTNSDGSSSTDGEDDALLGPDGQQQQQQSDEDRVIPDGDVLLDPVDIPDVDGSPASGTDDSISSEKTDSESESGISDETDEEVDSLCSSNTNQVKRLSLHQQHQQSLGLPWRPKIRNRDIESFLDYTRQKFIGYTLVNDRSTTFGLPDPIIESIRIMEKHVYVSLSEIQIQREEDLMRFRLTRSESYLKSLNSPTERLYQALLPTLSPCVISLLKVLLAASPTSRTGPTGTGGAGTGLGGRGCNMGPGASSSECMNIVSDCLPGHQSSSSSSTNDPMSQADTEQTVLQSMRIGIDVNRHKEVLVKAVSGTILLLLKHLKINHVYQFEYMAQQLMFANCIPLVLKFLNQNICQFIGSRNNISVIDFPICVIGEQPELTTENLDHVTTVWSGIGSGNSGSSQVVTAVNYSWRNMFSSINLLRILNKLTKWKHSRIMMLVVFKSAPILKKCLRLRHPMIQLYILKLLKMQAKYLGRQWRKANMKTMSAIYAKVRHRLTDDWAFGNDVDSRPWDFQAQEFSLQASINRFHHRRYGTPASNSSAATAAAHHQQQQQQQQTQASNAGQQQQDGEANDEDSLLQLLLDESSSSDNNIFSVLNQKIHLPQAFRDNYEQWLQREVFDQQTDWDQLLHETASSTSL